MDEKGTAGHDATNYDLLRRAGTSAVAAKLNVRWPHLPQARHCKFFPLQFLDGHFTDGKCVGHC